MDRQQAEFDVPDSPNPKRNKSYMDFKDNRGVYPRKADVSGDMEIDAVYKAPTKKKELGSFQNMTIKQNSKNSLVRRSISGMDR